MMERVLFGQDNERQASDENARQAESVSVDDAIDAATVASAKLLAGVVSELLGNPSQEKLARTLLMAGAGKGFDATYAYAIRTYVNAWQALRHYENPDLDCSEEVREDVLARFSRELRDRRQTLEILDVTVQEPKVGEAFDPQLHRPERFSTVDAPEAADVGRIARVHAPAFTWREDGREQIEAARVVLYSDRLNAEF